MEKLMAAGHTTYIYYKFRPNNFTRSELKFIRSTLIDPRGWSRKGYKFVQRRGRFKVDVEFEMASPDEIERRYGRRLRNFSVCESRAKGSLIVINSRNWKKGRKKYKQYVVNHEMGHAIGKEHKRMNPNKTTSTLQRCNVMTVQTNGSPNSLHSLHSSRPRNCILNPWT